MIYHINRNNWRQSTGFSSLYKIAVIKVSSCISFVLLLYQITADIVVWVTKFYRSEVQISLSDGKHRYFLKGWFCRLLLETLREGCISLFILARDHMHAEFLTTYRFTPIACFNHHNYYHQHCSCDLVIRTFIITLSPWDYLGKLSIINIFSLMTTS